jgi:hypothetical protein
MMKLFRKILLRVISHYEKKVVNSKSEIEYNKYFKKWEKIHNFAELQLKRRKDNVRN